MTTLAGALHANTRSVLSSFAHEDPSQQDLTVEYLNFLDACVDAVWRSSQQGHITASALVMDESGDRVLLTLHPKVGRWLQLGGHLEMPDATLRQAALREVREESGIVVGRISALPIRLDRHPVPCGRDADGGPLASVHWDVQYVVTTSSSTPVVISDESDDLQWFDVREIADVEPAIDASVHALIADAGRYMVRAQAADSQAPNSQAPNSWVQFG